MNLVLLPAVKDNINDYKKLNYHLYQAVKKSIYKPNAFFKGFILPLAEDANIREVGIIGSILQKCSITVMHASAALIKLTEIDGYQIGASFFIKIFLTKSYAFPSMVIDSLVKYFSKFTEGLNVDEEGNHQDMPVMWH